MKFTHTIAILFLCLTTTQAQFTPDLIGFQYSEFEKYKKLKVKEQIEKIVDVEFSDEALINSITTFTENGELQMTALNPEIISEEAIDTIKYFYEYNADGRISVMSIYGLDIVPIVYGFFYDKKGKLYEGNIASAEARRMYYEMNKKGNVVKAIAKSANFEYDEEGNASETYTWVPTEETTYEWNEKGWLMEERSTYKMEFSYHAIYKYDTKGNLIEENFCYDAEHPDTPSTIIKFEYDENGLLKKRKLSSPGSEEQYEYIFEYTFYK